MPVHLVQIGLPLMQGDKMDLVNATQNQHFVSQAEQRLNAINPNAKQNNQRIYAFSIVDRDASEIRLLDQKGCKIESNLNFRDLFSFDILNSVHRHNFEQLFQQYEEDIILHTCRFSTKVNQGDDDVIDELVNIFRLKLLNTLRNPYSITRSLKIFLTFSRTHIQRIQIYTGNINMPSMEIDLNREHFASISE